MIQDIPSQNEDDSLLEKRPTSIMLSYGSRESEGEHFEPENQEELGIPIDRKTYRILRYSTRRLVMISAACFVSISLFHTAVKKSLPNNLVSGLAIFTQNKAPGVLDTMTPIIQAEIPRVEEGVSSFPSYWNYQGKPMNVSYNERSILINDDRVFLLGGSLHPSRATRATWERALNEAVQNGLNLITLYVVWSLHQPFSTSELNWSFPIQPDWTLAEAILAAKDRGLFVHVRIGPYICAEYSYGGIPEWVPLKYPDILMRRPNQDWLTVMEYYVKRTIEYLTRNHLWAYQGGPILLGQIENELGGEIEEWERPFLLRVHQNGTFLPPKSVENHSNYRIANLQDYADWCGRLVQRLAPEVLWTMCNGLTAKNTIETFNGDNLGVSFLRNHGQSGFVQLSHPALWTEDEGGFQIWGEEPARPSDYFWGRTARSMAYRAIQWIARGGSHLNYYMWWGGYNRGRAAGAGIMNKYASDAVLCSSAERRQPKFDHFTSLHSTMKGIASTILNQRTQMNSSFTVKRRDKTGPWSESRDQVGFLYVDLVSGREITFLENNSNRSYILRYVSNFSGEEKDYLMPAFSAKVLDGGKVLFDSHEIHGTAEAYQRNTVTVESHSFSVQECHIQRKKPKFIQSEFPVEHAEILAHFSESTDYVWYRTSFESDEELSDPRIFVGSQKATAILLFIDGDLQDWGDNHDHSEGNITFVLIPKPISKGQHNISILTESLGYYNLVGRWGASVQRKAKGIIGEVVIENHGKNQSLVDGRPWLSTLHTFTPVSDSRRIPFEIPEPEPPSISCSNFTFRSPSSERKELFLEITLGRGHIWLNGHDLGRFWNITRGASGELSQPYYHLPNDLLVPHGENEILLFDVFGNNHSDVRLISTWTTNAGHSNVLDEIDFPTACL